MDKNSGQSSSAGSHRPFYELPAHIKPCSRIIQETRQQLKYSRGTSSSGFDQVLRNRPNSFGGAGDLGSLTKSGEYFDLPDREESPLGSFTIGGIRPVNTQRPFTPRDSISLWGVSARKRPPSAITLSRLSIEEVEESPDSSGDGSSLTRLGNQRFIISPQSGRLKPLVPKTSVGSLLGQISVPLETSTDVERTRLKVKSLSLDKVTSPRPKHQLSIGEYVDPSWTLGSVPNNERGNFSSKKSELNKFDGNQNDPTTNVHNSVPHDRVQVDNLQMTIEYLKCFLVESATDEKPHKSDVVSILKKIREDFSNDQITVSLKRQLLHLIFKLVEKNQTDEDILFWSSFVLLHCNIVGNNLTTVFKMVFKSSRSKDYKDIIKDTEYLDVLMKSFSQICPKTQTESMIYGYGTLKFICGENDILSRLIQLDLIRIMALHLKILNCEITEMGKASIPEALFNGTFQLTSILRSVVGEDSSLSIVVQSGLLDELCTTLDWTLDDIDVLTNTVRILSVVSMNIMCCQVMYTNQVFCGAVVRVLKHWYSKDDVMVRLTYCLGNLLANSDDMRFKLYEEPDAFQYILKVLSHQIEKSSPTPITMDILVKTTRILANWILNPFVGSEICDDPELSELLYGILQLKDISQELLLCLMCALNNTSFYMNYNELDEGTVKTVEYLYQNLEMKDLDARTEAVKVLGNLTRNEDVRLLSSEYMENILSSLEENSVELLCATCGVLINIIIEEQVKKEFLRKKGIERLIQLLDRSNDKIVSLMSSQVVWNLLISHENQGLDSNQCISADKRSQLKRILIEKVHHGQDTQSTASIVSSLPESDSEDSSEAYNYQAIVEDFETVAKDLIAKL